MKKNIVLIAFICITTSSFAQIHEIGILAGGSNYIGDIGSEYYINPNSFMGGVIYKWNVNPRISYRGTFTFTQLIADDANATNQARLNRGINFKNSLKELALGLEFNYFEYNLDDFSKTKTPYLLVEIAAFNYKTIVSGTDESNYEYETNTSFAIPFGVGYKTKLFGDFAIALELKARYTFVDNLDFNNDKIDSLKFGNPNSNDWYIFSGFNLVYTFGRPPCYSTPY
ncbi:MULTISPECIES: type IX secretion system protein PorG [Flavobacteriaceae]|uniref:DUF6089 domain-containing protein n=2 Tax=Flavobacteriaceae TaxID=49546 RepID=A0A4Y8APD7_9FLAO|nr:MULTISPECIES: DUF6089 family protein [Flavobacteriaceae]TEW72469.1 hypothetical protein E2488_13520 [Gramella jeungdoensis]GGK55495.1 hypothetical protein GCM10007963_24790 [Lutibacter litoralis]